VRPPAVTPGVGFINYAFTEFGLRVMAERVKDDGYCELRFWLKNGTGGDIAHKTGKDAENTNANLIHTTGIKLLSTSATDNLAKRLAKSSDTIPWPEVITFITNKTIEIARRGEQLIEVSPSEDDTLEVEYLLEPLLYRNHPTIIFGDYGSLKSLMALSIGYIVQLPFHDNELGLTTSTESTKCLYLDWEDDLISFRKRLGALERGFGNGTMPILYQHMTNPLSNSAEQIQRIIQDKNIELVIIDSLAPAARGNLNDTEPAIRYHAALRELGVTSLTLAHTAKDQLTKKRTIFGSIFFTNLTRLVWECKAEQEIGEDEAIISLKNTKANFSRLHPALGYRFTFNNYTIQMAQADLRNTSLSGELPLSLQIKNLLRGGAKTVREIAEALDANEASVRTAINRMKDKNELTKAGNSWGLPYQGAMEIKQGAI